MTVLRVPPSPGGSAGGLSVKPLCVLLTAVLLMGGVGLCGQVLPEAPPAAFSGTPPFSTTGTRNIPQPVHATGTRIATYSLWAGYAAARAADWASTEECLRLPSHLCHEAELPGITANRIAFAVFEVGMTGAVIYVSHRLGKEHRWMGLGISATSFTLLSIIDAHNYQVIEAARSSLHQQ